MVAPKKVGKVKPHFPDMVGSATTTATTTTKTAAPVKMNFPDMVASSLPTATISTDATGNFEMIHITRSGWVHGTASLMNSLFKILHENCIGISVELNL